jgi:hypothetical protein
MWQLEQILTREIEDLGVAVGGDPAKAGLEASAQSSLGGLGVRIKPGGDEAATEKRHEEWGPS